MFKVKYAKILDDGSLIADLVYDDGYEQSISKASNGATLWTHSLESWVKWVEAISIVYNSVNFVDWPDTVGGSELDNLGYGLWASKPNDKKEYTAVMTDFLKELTL